MPIWKRAILSSLIGAIGGSSVIGFVNRYALYWHALSQGFRVPVEGVEYLDLAITIVSFAVIFTSVVGSLFVYSLINKVADVVAALLVSSGNPSRKSTARRVTIIVQIVGGIIPGVISIFKLFSPDSKLLKEPLADTMGTVLIVISTVLMSLMLLLLIGFMVLNKDSKKKIFTLATVAIGIIVIVGSMFNQRVYGYFLNTIGYGGNRVVEIEYRQADNTQALESGLLLIKTTDCVTIRKDGATSEIPISRISKLTYVNEKTANNE